MIAGVGIDVVDVERFAGQLERAPRLRERLFVAHERDLSLKSLAARFAAKEALAKALGAPGNLFWQDAEVHNDEHGRPYFRIRGSVARRAEELGVARLHLSLSHDAGIASALVIAETTPPSAREGGTV